MIREDCIFCDSAACYEYGCEALKRRYCEEEDGCGFFKSKDEYDMDPQTRFVTRKRKPD